MLAAHAVKGRLTLADDLAAAELPSGAIWEIMPPNTRGFLNMPTDSLTSLPELRRAIADFLRTEFLPQMKVEIERALASRHAEPEFASVNETLQMLRISRTQLYRLFAQGTLQPIKRGRTTLLHRGDIQRFVDTLRQGRCR